MVTKRGWLQFGSKLLFPLSIIVILTGCAKVTIQCPPSTAMGVNTDTPPTGRFCMIVDGQCKAPKRGTCTCSL